MIQIKPFNQHQSSCPHCGNLLKPLNIVWQGVHVCARSHCEGCSAEIIEDLKIGHAINNSYQVDLNKGAFFGNKSSVEWLGRPLFESLNNPQREKISITTEVFTQCDSVVILNCIDFLYGHCLLKLLNAQRHLEHNLDHGLVVIVPKFLRWMVPEGAAEIWTVDISLKNSQLYYPEFDRFVSEESTRFDEIYISEAYSHPSQFDISFFTQIRKHDFGGKDFKVTFIWREDRLWCNFLLFRVLRKLKLTDIALFLQNRKVKKLFAMIREKVPSAKFTIAGLGNKTKFPKWVEDYRVDKFDEKTEKGMCLLYSQSRLVIGVHGSNMLLPSGHAGMIIDLMPEERWGNFTQDILYQETDPRLAAFRYRYLPFQASVSELAHIAAVMVLGYLCFSSHMIPDKSV